MHLNSSPPCFGTVPVLPELITLPTLFPPICFILAMNFYQAATTVIAKAVHALQEAGRLTGKREISIGSLARMKRHPAA